jgi:cobalt-zinc-cadmium efflux system outer membrane protein
MSMRRLLALTGLLLLSGCSYHVRQQTDETVCDLASRPLDVSAPPDDLAPSLPLPRIAGPAAAAPRKPANSLIPPTDVRTTALMLGGEDINPAVSGDKLEVNIPLGVPGAETERILPLPKDETERAKVLQRLYPNLPPLPAEPVPLPGPEGHPYTLADLQLIAADNSPALRQAASDVKAAEGNLIAARAYPNPTVGIQNQPSNDGSTAGVWGFFLGQQIKTGGKLHLASAAAEIDLHNAELALRRARTDLSTQVRTAYFALLVARETMRVNEALARFTDQMFQLQLGQLKAGISAPYEPAAMRAQVWTIRLAYKQAIDNYVMAWKQLVATIGLRQLPLTEVSGRVDRAIPYFDYDAVLFQVLQNHTDVLTARNGIEKTRYNLKLAQVTPVVPDLEVQVGVQKEFVVAPELWAYTFQVGVPLPIWDQNKGPIMAAEAALVRATEEPHRVETTLSNNVATAYQSYKTSLEGLEYYRRYILPDQVRAYRGVYERRQVDPNWTLNNFNDLLTAQQTLTTGVASYLTILGQLWTAVVNVADFLQTDDLFQFGQPEMLPPLPELEQLCPWPCPHPCGTAATGPCPCREGVCHSTTEELYPHFSFEKEAIPAGKDCPPAPSNRQAP